jgi:hypothetical protein
MQSFDADQVLFDRGMPRPEWNASASHQHRDDQEFADQSRSLHYSSSLQFILPHDWRLRRQRTENFT